MKLYIALHIVMALLAIFTLGYSIWSVIDTNRILKEFKRKKSRPKNGLLDRFKDCLC